MPYSLLMDLTEKQVKFFTDSGKTLRRFFSPKNKAYFRSFNLNHSISVFYGFFLLLLSQLKLKLNGGYCYQERHTILSVSQHH